jgi:hypothetical protein
MKGIAIILVALLLVSCSSVSYKWTKADKIGEIMALTALTADYLQTRYIASHGDEYRETNFILGEHPSKGQVNAYFAGLAAFNVGTSIILPSKIVIGNDIVLKPRLMWQTSTFLGHGYAVMSNYNLGVGMEW